MSEDACFPELWTKFTSFEKQQVYESEKVVILNVETNIPGTFCEHDYFATAKPDEFFWQNLVIQSKRTLIFNQDETQLWRIWK